MYNICIVLILKAQITMAITSMRMMLIFLLSMTLGACSSLRPLSPNAELSQIERIDEQTILFTGTITGASVAQFQKALTPNTNKVLLDSPGGYARSAIEMAHSIFDRALDVEVTARCFSSCANYLFPAGRRKIIGKEGLLMWHGCGQYDSYLDQINHQKLTENNKESYEEFIGLEQKLLKKIGMDEFICWFGMIPPYNARFGYTLSKEDMRQFGINGIEVRDNYPTVSSIFLNLKYLTMAPKIKVDWANLENLRAKAYELSRSSKTQ
jgi:hypothetical protein